MRYYLGEPLDSEQKRETWEILVRFFTARDNQLEVFYDPKSQFGSNTAKLLTQLLGSTLKTASEPTPNGKIKVKVPMTIELAKELFRQNPGPDATHIPDLRLIKPNGTDVFSSTLYGTDTLFDCSEEDLEQLRKQLDAANLEYRIDVLGTAKEYREEGDEARGITRTRMVQLRNRKLPAPPRA